MWRRLAFSQLRALSGIRSAPKPHRLPAAAASSSTAALRPSVTIFSRHFASESGNVATKKRVEDVMPIATGHEREELEAELEVGLRYEEGIFCRLTILLVLLVQSLPSFADRPAGKNSLREEPAVIQSVYGRRIVGCPGGEGEDEHDVVWFWLEKDKPHECPVCSQYFMLEIVGSGGDPEGHSDDEHH